jgi:hypothetical protein
MDRDRRAHPHQPGPRHRPVAARRRRTADRARPTRWPAVTGGRLRRSARRRRSEPWLTNVIPIRCST